jgi:hypothetical protein
VLAREQFLEVAVVDALILLRGQLQDPLPEPVVRLVGRLAPAVAVEQARETVLSSAAKQPPDLALAPPQDLSRLHGAES